MEQKQFKFNMPEQVKSWLEGRAAKNMRSQGAEIVHMLTKEMEAEQNEAA